MEEPKINQAIILAGGRGRRLEPFTDYNPKPMYPICGKPFIEYLIKQIAAFGIDNILILLGYLPEKIMGYLGSGDRYGVQITYNVTPEEYDTGERLLSAEKQIEDKFLLLYCDNYCPIDFRKLERDFYFNNSLVQISAYANKEHYTKDNLKISGDGCVAVYDKKRTQDGLQGVDIGYALLKKEALDVFRGKKDISQSKNFEMVVYPELVKERLLYATITEHRYYSIGSWERIDLTTQFFAGMKTIFLDRDGTINVRPPKACYVEKEEDFVWLCRAKEAIKLLKENNYRVIVVSNQPGIARGRLTEEKLQKIHQKMQTELKQETGYEIDAIYYCPHNWDEGCDCRKPKPGMLYQAQKDYSLNLTECVLIGDDERDIEAGKAARCKCIQIDENYDLFHAVNDLLAEEI